MLVREIVFEDIPAIFEVRVATWHNENGREEMAQLGITHDAVREVLEAGTHRGWLAESDEGDVIGFTMGIHESGEMWVIAVLPEHENHGIGRELMQVVEDWLFESSDEIWLTTDEDENFRAVGFYRALGWEDWKMEGGDRFMRKSKPA